MKKILNSYSNYIKVTNKVKQNVRNEQLKKKLIISNNVDTTKRFTLYDLEQMKKKIRSSVIQNEISSISKLMNGKIIRFTTNTINSNMNVDKDFPIYNDERFQFGELENRMFKQYEEFKKYNKSLRNYNYNDENGLNKKINGKSLRVFELTKSFNIHQHRIDVLNDFTELKEYIKSIFYKRNNTNIGRTEIRVDEQILNKILETEITIRINNKNETLEFIKKYDEESKRDFYIIKNSMKNNGNFIYLKPIKDIRNDKTHLTNYLFKYLLKASDEGSLENMVFSKIGVRQQQYSHKFFCDMEKMKLQKISSIIYREVKRKNILFKDMELDINSILYETSKMINNQDLIIQEDIIYIRNNNEYKKLTSITTYDKLEFSGYYSEYKRLEEKKYINETITIKEELIIENKKKMEYYENLYYKDMGMKELCLYDKVISTKYEIKTEFRENPELIIKRVYNDNLTTENDIIKKRNEEKKESKQTRTEEKERIEKLIYKYYEKMEDDVSEYYKNEDKNNPLNIEKILSSTSDYRIELYDKF